jgi:hypothetical protein
MAGGGRSWLSIGVSSSAPDVALIALARDIGCSEFDLVGAPNKGIAAYKRKFGAAERLYTTYRKETYFTGRPWRRSTSCARQALARKKRANALRLA